MDASIKEPGLYFFPGIYRKHASEEERKQWEEKYRAGPAGLIVYKPVGGELMPPSKLFVQLGMDVGIGLIAALLLQGASVWLGKFASRVAFVSLLGLLPALAVNLPYWNWYGFPPLFTLCQFADRAIGFVLIGVTLGLILRPTAVQLRQSP